MGICIYDADSLVYRIGHISDKHPEPHKVYRMFVRAAVAKLRKVAVKTFTVTEEHFYITSSDRSNFRFDVDALYKANRVKNKKPSMYDQIREQLVEEFNAEVVSGMEADDKVSIEMWKIYRANKRNKIGLLFSADKDCRIIPGLKHETGDGPVYECHMPGVLNVYRSNKGRYVWGNGIKWFYYQMLAGDTIDNILPELNLSPFECYELLNYHTEEKDMCATVWEQYRKAGKDPEHFLKMGRLLWLRTEEDEELWNPPILI